MRKPRYADIGWDPMMSWASTHAACEYWPGGYQPATLSGASYEMVSGYYRRTRGGLHGVDYGGGENDR